jgi:hypothetical protein
MFYLCFTTLTLRNDHTLLAPLEPKYTFLSKDVLDFYFNSVLPQESLPGATDKRHIRCFGLWGSIRIVDSRYWSSVVVAEPNHDFIDVGATSGGRGEQIISDRCDDGASA